MKVLLVLAFFVSSCSVLMPYEEDTLCAKGKEGGYCGSISSVYKKTLEEDGNEAISSYELCITNPELCQ